MENPTEQFDQAVELARSGEKEPARDLFTKIVSDEPQNYRAWLWLSELTINLEQQTAMLEQAIEVIPAGLDLQAELSNLYGFVAMSAIALPAPAAQNEPAAPAPKPLNHAEIYQKAERLTLLGKRAEALSAIQTLTWAGSSEERVWLLCSELDPTLGEKVRSLENALKINPGNSTATFRLHKLHACLHQPLQAGKVLEDWGEFDQALDLYQAIAARPASAAEKVEAQSAINRLTHSQSQKPASPSQKSAPSLLTLARSLFPRKKPD